MSESIIVSESLEGVIDKENVFGSYSQGTIPLVIWIKNTIINTEVLSLKTTKDTTRIGFMASPNLAQDLLVHRDPDCVIIGEEGKNSLTIENCKTRSLAVTAKDNMYLCKIIIEKTE
jgi:hypothetical protein|tara:strand:- start:29 stop:379 length:351 start_codon:yes stop_codon:yes gene_type:complete